MPYNAGDVVKIDLEEQVICPPYSICCPYVYVVSDDGDDSDDGSAAKILVFANILSAERGHILRNVSIYVRTEGSELASHA